MTEQAGRIFRAVIGWFRALSPREQQLVGAAGLVVVVFAVYYLCGLVYAAFDDLNVRIARAESDLNTVSQLLEKYSRVKEQRDAIESEYKSVEFKEPELSYLEDLIRRKLGLSSGFTITPKTASAFGENYEQNPFNIKFATNDMKNIFDFLTEIVSGPQPLLLTRLDMRVNRTGDSIDVDIDVSSIKRTAGS